MLGYYVTMFGLSLFFTIVYAFMWHKHFDVNITLIFLLIPLGNLAYVAVARASELQEAVLAIQLVYLSSTFAILFIMIAILGLCHIRLSRIKRAVLILATALLYLPVLTIERTNMFYKNVELVERNGVSILTGKDYGPMHTVLHIWILLCFLICFVALIYSHIKKNDVSHKIIYLLFVPVLVCVLCFFVGRRITEDIELVPAAYVFAQFMYLLVVYRISLYDINDSGLDSLLQKGGTGFASFDFKLRYLGCNEVAEKCLPMLVELHVDKPIKEIAELQDNVVMWISAFIQKESTGNAPVSVDIFDDGDEDVHFHYKNKDGSKTYHVEVNYLFDGRKKRGYQLFITDDTADVKYMEFQERFNTVLRNQVDQKTDRIRQMNDHLLFSMATMVESRDPFTGGHIKRTSEGVRLLIEEMKKDTSLGLSKKFCERVVKAAPMHDLGKIAVPDAILMKPGRYEPEEYEIMKSHSAEGAKVVHEILKDSDDQAFCLLAENVAHYHHERWDGKGYPEHLSGAKIPLEARIMAVADVYDALVSKRVYKEKMPPEKANAIIMEGMGTQFDPGLQKYYEAARPKLEAYYAAQLNADATQKTEEIPQTAGAALPSTSTPQESESQPGSETATKKEGEKSLPSEEKK